MFSQAKTSLFPAVIAPLATLGGLARPFRGKAKPQRKTASGRPSGAFRHGKGWGETPHPSHRVCGAEASRVKAAPGPMGRP